MKATTEGIAIVGMACRYPDAKNPQELWENVLAKRQAFRRLPPERLNLADYGGQKGGDSDSTYATCAAVLTDWEFDRSAFKVSGTAFRAADLAHWLALDVATQALADAGFASGDGLPHDTTGAVVGNTLTGEFSRAGLMRLRWPYVRRVVGEALHREGRSPEEIGAFLATLEQEYKSPFPAMNEESLAGGLSNTIAGRICNHFDLHGGGYTVDGACASSLLAVTTACNGLLTGDMDVALAGGVDLSLDPFELVGFSRAGALATDDMRVYDERSAGFWPGEGCGFVVMMRAEDAVKQGRSIYARIRGWGVSSDGSGGITRPEVEGQLLALRRAYCRAGFGADTVGYFEGHGTGTAVGDATEITALSRARRESAPEARPAALGSIKANIGHTKAAAGVAGLIKTTLALQCETLPPNTGCERPHGLLSGDSPALRILREPEYWQNGAPRRAGVSAMGFGGINTHIAMEEAKPHTRPRSVNRETSASTQDAELFLLTAESIEGLRDRITHLLTIAPDLSRAEITDAAASLSQEIDPIQPIRAAVIADRPDSLTRGLNALHDRLSAGEIEVLDPNAGIFLGKTNGTVPRIGLIFPGQGTTAHPDGGWLCRRFDVSRETFAHAPLPHCEDAARDTAYAQPAIVAAEMAGVYALEVLGIHGEAAIGHSLGELAALCWSGAMNLADLLHVAEARGKAMASLGANDGAMASLATDADTAKSLLDGTEAGIAAINAPRQTVVSGPVEAVRTVTERAKSRGIGAKLLPVAFAFHSSLVAPAIPPLRAALDTISANPVERPVYSTITGDRLPADTNLCDLLSRQVTDPVRFLEALRHADTAIDLWLEIGPGQVLSGLTHAATQTPAFAIDATGPSARGFLQATGTAFVLGANVNPTPLYANRLIRPFNWQTRPHFLANPCEAASALGIGNWALGEKAEDSGQATAEHPTPNTQSPIPNTSPLETVRAVIMEKAEFSREAVTDTSRMLSDLHLNSLLVSQIVVEAARRCGVTPSAAPTEAADATVTEIAAALEAGLLGGNHKATRQPETLSLFPGIDAWVREFTVDWVEMPLSETTDRDVPAGEWTVFAPPGCAFADVLRSVLTRGSGVALCLPSNAEDEVGLLLTAARSAFILEKRLLLVQEKPGSAAFVRSLHLETPDIPVTVVTLPMENLGVATWVAQEVAAHATGFVEARYNPQGQRSIPIMRLLPPDPVPAAQRVPGTDHRPATLLVTGGGKGITAECALALARQTGAKLALIGRADPAEDAKLAANLERMAADTTLRYYRADVTDAESVREAVRRAEAELGPITGVLHGAGTNTPTRLHDLSEVAFRKTLAPKVDGLRNVLSALDTNRLNLLVTFGSIIGRVGFRGNADYAAANERLTCMTEEYAAAHPECLCRALEWSVWSGVGMGERLGAVDALVRDGVQPISVDEGVRRFLDLIQSPLPSTSVVITGRFGNAPTVRLTDSNGGIPSLRFLETVRAYYPGLELVADSEVSHATDPYLPDHAYQGEPLLPAVLGMEAMAQAAMTVVGTTTRPTFSDVAFRERITIMGDDPVTVRVIAQVQADGRVKTVLRSSRNGFATDHFSALCRFDNRVEESDTLFSPNAVESPSDPNLVENLYESLLFHGPYFQRVTRYTRLKATECVAEIRADTRSPFANRIPDTLYLGDPGARDAALHAVQATLPQRTLLPISVESVEFFGNGRENGKHLLRAQEIAREGDRFVYDLDIADEAGRIIERWLGLKFQALTAGRERGVPLGALLGPYLERVRDTYLPNSPLSIAVEVGTPDEARQERSDRAIYRALGSDVAITRRPDGKPEVKESDISTSHCGNLTLAVSGMGTVACDLEAISVRSATEWRDLLGTERFTLAESLARANREDLGTAATRIWTAAECLMKAGTTPGAPLSWETAEEGNSVLLTSGNRCILTVLLPTREGEVQHIAAFLTEKQDRAYEYRHVVSFEETNVVGNVYYTNHLLWQGRCREMFLWEHCPEVLEDLKNGLALVTLNVCCRYLAELTAFDEVIVRMRLASLGESEMSLRFDFLRVGSEEVIARGEQQLGCMRRVGDRLIPTAVPVAMRQALAEYRT